MAIDAGTIKTIFLAALERATPAERATYLDEACAGDAEMRRKVEAMLLVHEGRDALLDQPAVVHLAAEIDSSVLDFLPTTTAPDGSRRLGHFTLLEVVGKGGMGVVIRAFDSKLHRVVAIKVLAPALASNADARQRFVREARAAAAVSHDNVIGIHAVEDGDPVPYLVMQYVEGCTLQQKLDRVGPLPLKEVLRIGLQTAEGLAAAHRQGLIHRDIKPSNILLENGVERVKITDFGLARTADDPTLTRSGFLAGTPAYMSPEQADGKRVDHRSDLFSLGSVLYALCAGEPPFRGETTLSVLKHVCDETPRPLRDINPDIPEWLELLIARLHFKAPSERSSSASEVAAELSRRLAELQSQGYFCPLDVEATANDRSRRPTSPNALWIALAVGALGFFGLLYWFNTQVFNTQRSSAAFQDLPTPTASAPALPILLKSNPPMMKHANGVRSITISRDGRVMASGGLDGQIYLWDTATWETRGPLSGHRGEVAGLSFSPDGTRLASVTGVPDAHVIRVWDAATGQQVDTFGENSPGMWGVAYSPDGSTLACGGWDRALNFFDVKSKTKRTIPHVTTGWTRALSYSPDGTRIAVGGRGRTRLVDTATDQEVPTPHPLRQDFCPTILFGGKRLAGWTHLEGRITLYDLPSGQVRATWRAHPKIEGLAASADGRFLASYGIDGVVPLWTTEDQSEFARATGHKGAVYAAAFTPDGARLVTGGAEDFSVRVWELPDICRTVK
jgi:serine/threonine protein kinase